MEVTPDDQKELFKENNHRKYVKRRNNKVVTLSLENFIADELQGYSILIDPTDYEEQ